MGKKDDNIMSTVDLVMVQQVVNNALCYNKINIDAKNNNKSSMYVNQVKLNTLEYTKNWFSHTDLREGANIIFNMGDKPNFNWGSKIKDIPYSMSTAK